MPNVHIGQRYVEVILTIKRKLPRKPGRFFFHLTVGEVGLFTRVNYRFRAESPPLFLKTISPMGRRPEFEAEVFTAQIL
ncbi:MAG: hypothetical protein JWM68_2956 [Verrucomicrobiales bacterium]|nr:hypothetical protein [Verrucomicrobiales bacterium]